ncbi:hypothetical protein B7486_76355, partial [cyanobacterium TDX16]
EHSAEGAAGPSIEEAVIPTLGEQHAELAARWTPAQREVLEASSTRFRELTALDMVQQRTRDEEVGAIGQVTVASVARASGVSRRAIYNLWASVTDLRLDLLRGFMGAERAWYEQGLQRVGDGPAAASELVAALVRPPAADRLSAAQARLAFLPDANHPAVQQVYVAELDRTVATMAQHADRLW